MCVMFEDLRPTLNVDFENSGHFRKTSVRDEKLRLVLSP